MFTPLDAIRANPKLKKRAMLMRTINKTIQRQLAKFDGYSVNIYFLRKRIEWDENVVQVLDMYYEKGWSYWINPHRKDPNMKRIYGFTLKPKRSIVEQLMEVR